MKSALSALNDDSIFMYFLYFITLHMISYRYVNLLTCPPSIILKAGLKR